MQTFMPHSCFRRVADILDDKRLGKQRVECLQILKVLIAESNGERPSWVNHPAVRMWRGHEYWLKQYGYAMCAEWSDIRGYEDTVVYTLREMPFFSGAPPAWLDDHRVHISHRSNLLRKDYKHYSKFWPETTSDLPYYWPV